MIKLRVTREALREFYSASISLIIGADVFSELSAVMPEMVTAFCLHESGVISMSAATVEATVETIKLSGMPAGILAVFSGEHLFVQAKSILEYAEHHGAIVPPYKMFESSVIAKQNSTVQIDFLKYVNGILTRQLSSNYDELAAVERRLVHFRKRNEELWYGFEKARRMIAGIGYSTRSIGFELAPGDTSLRLNELPTRAFAQILPIDLAGFSGVGLFVSEMGAADSDGELKILVRRRADNIVVGETVISYKDLHLGWNSFEMERSIGRTFGDGILILIASDDEPPKFAFGKQKADRFGHEAKTLAIRIYKGLEEPPLEIGEVKSSSWDTVSTKHNGIEVYHRGLFFGGVDKEEACNTELKASVLTTDPNEEWLQIHPVQKGLSGLQIPKYVRQYTTELRALVSLDHEASSPVVAAVFVASSDALANVDVEAIMDKLGDGYPVSGVEKNVHWTSSIVSAQSQEELTLTFEKPIECSSELLLLVKPAGHTNEYGWCRWHTVEMRQMFSVVSDDLPKVSAVERLQAESQKMQIRAHKFPELVGQVEYYLGKSAKQELSEKLGFSPLIISDETGAMQTHPLTDGVSAAVMEGGVPERALRIMAEVGTAHEHAGEFTYIMMVLPLNLENRSEIIEEISEKVREGLSANSDETTGIYWQSRTVKTLVHKTLEINFNDTRNEAADVVFAAIPVNDSISFGWCSWYLYAAGMAGFSDPVSILETPSDTGV